VELRFALLAEKATVGPTSAITAEGILLDAFLVEDFPAAHPLLYLLIRLNAAIRLPGGSTTAPKDTTATPGGHHDAANARLSLGRAPWAGAARVGGALLSKQRPLPHARNTTMTVSSDTTWPYRHALVRTAIALLLAMGSMMSDGRISTLLLAVGLVVALVAAMRFWQAWRSAHIRRPFI
jgi:hypothetical protein